MLSIDAKPDIETLSRALRVLGERQLPFVLANTATQLARRVKSGTLRAMRQRLDRPTSTTMNSLYVKMAKKGDPVARSYFKDAWASGIPADRYLRQTVHGGARRHKRFEKALIARGLMKSSQYAIPAASAMNQYGNVSGATVMRILSGLGAAESAGGYQANATGSKRSRRKGNAERYFVGDVGGTEGVWERKKTAFGDAVRPVFVFSDSAPRYRAIVPMFKIADNIVKANYMTEFTSALDQALATTRA